MPRIKSTLTRYVIKQENMTQNQEKKNVQSMGIDPKMTQLLELADQNFKAATEINSKTFLKD